MGAESQPGNAFESVQSPTLVPGKSEPNGAFFAVELCLSTARHRGIVAAIKSSVDETLTRCQREEDASNSNKGIVLGSCHHISRSMVLVQ